MKFNEIKEIMELVSKYGFDYYKLQHDDAIIEIGKNDRVSNSQKSEVTSANSTPVVERQRNKEEESVADAVVEEAREAVIDGHIVKAPIVGTFYASASPEKDDFVTLGSKVKKGDVICIIEAMKIMNEIVADKDGEIVEIFCKNEDMVEFDAPLFTIA